MKSFAFFSLHILHIIIFLFLSSHRRIGMSSTLVSIPGRRGVFKDFINGAELQELLALFEDKEGHLNTVDLGLYVIHGMQLAHSVKQGLHSNENVQRLKTFNAVRDRIYRFASTFFEQDMRVESVIVNLRLLPNNNYTWNSTIWTHGVHVDNCALEYPPVDAVFSNFTCVYNPCCARRHFTAILYFSECAGGELLFLDPPQDGQTRGFARMTRVPPEPGKLVLFTSGPDNIHGVSQLLSSGKRYTMSIWFSNGTDNERSPHAYHDVPYLDKYIRDGPSTPGLGYQQLGPPPGLGYRYVGPTTFEEAVKMQSMQNDNPDHETVKSEQKRLRGIPSINVGPSAKNSARHSRRLSCLAELYKHAH